MISLIRLEAEGKSIAEVVKQIDSATRKLGPFADHLCVHDEHYERVTETLFKGRRVFRPFPKVTGKPVLASIPSGAAATSGTSVSHFTVTA